MSCEEWANGTITLPAGWAASIKKELAEFMNALHDEVRTEAVRIHVEVARRTRSHEVYRQRLFADRDAREVWARGPEAHALYGNLNPRNYAEIERRYRADFVHEFALRAVDEMFWQTKAAGTGPRQPTVTHIKRVAPRATATDTVFPVFGPDGAWDATITFDGDVLIWDVPSNNNAVAHANSAPLTEVIFRSLDRVRWTTGTGGVITGGDEYTGTHSHPARTYGSGWATDPRFR